MTMGSSFQSLQSRDLDFQDQCIEAIHCLRHVFVATATGRPKSWQGNAVFQTLLQKTLLFLCGSFELNGAFFMAEASGDLGSQGPK